MKLHDFRYRYCVLPEVRIGFTASFLWFRFRILATGAVSSADTTLGIHDR